MQFIQRKGNTTLREIAEFIASKKFAKVDLRDEDIACIIQTLVYDGRVDTVRLVVASVHMPQRTCLM